MTSVTFRGSWPDVLEHEAETQAATLVADNAIARIWDRDHTLWQPDPTEIADRLGWLDAVEDMTPKVDALSEFAAGCVNDGLTDAVVLGMGGSSLFPEVVARTYPSSAMRLRTLDTTDPAAIARVLQQCDPTTTLFVAASKSGTTIETRSQLEYFWSQMPHGDRFVAITDPGSELAAVAAERGFRATFENRADIGGRFSALSLFGLVPAALHGVDVAAMLRSAGEAADACRSNETTNPAVVLAGAIVAATRAGRDKLTLIDDPALAEFGLWFEQLIAESTGKHGVGVVPVVGERRGSDMSTADRLFVRWSGAADAPDAPTVSIDRWGANDLGALVFLWEMTTALVGVGLGINPFDQPDVASAKSATNEVLSAGLGAVDEVSLESLTELVHPGDYVAVTAYVDPGSDDVEVLEQARQVLGDRLGVATTFGLGPRFLHSTGQLHKGGADNAVIVQVVGVDAEEVPIPEQSFGFSMLKQAQAEGDLRALQSRQIRAGRVSLESLLALGH